MLFNSWGYIAFLFIAIPLVWLIPQRWQPWLIASFGLGLYAMWRWEFVFLLLFTTGVDFFCARAVSRTTDRRVRRIWLLSTLIVNLGLLAYFKYTYFIVDNVGAAASLFGFPAFSHDSLGLAIILPLGISFYTFHSISYTIDVYRGTTLPTNRYSVFLTYVTFWPQLVAGPILRATEVIPQLLARRQFRIGLLSEGGLLIITGLFKKVVLADSVGPMVDAAFKLNPSDMGALDVWVACILFGYQIYFDFSGYSDIAIGSAKLIGIDFPKNFDWPYLATSPRDFWHRWHISLSSWIRDYLYLPLVGKRFMTNSSGGIEAVEGETLQRTLALFLTWFIMGLWHGAAWNFALWGIYHASLVSIYRFVPRLQAFSSQHPWAGRSLMFPLAMAGWIPFRSQSLEQTFTMFGKLIDPSQYGLALRVAPGRGYITAVLLTFGMGVLFVAREKVSWDGLPNPVRAFATAGAVAIMAATWICLQQPVSMFIYFQF
jgi:D-alanyl-lipoteichoic acid acyltransferase DltB (MBOAT superfamily)